VYYITVGKILIPQTGYWEVCDTWQQKVKPSPTASR
jgi:hypothetical protein